MSAQASDEIGETARLWAIRVHDPSFDDWDGFTEWLEGDPSHLAAYETAQADDAWVADLFASQPRSLPLAPRRPRRTRFAAGAAVAAVIAMVGGWAVLERDAPARDIATALGEHRSIDLADGSRMVLNGGTRVTFDPDTPRHVELVQGEALFEVRHDDRDPFVVLAGGTRLVDAGTVFNVVREGSAVDVAVAEGAVVYEPGPREVQLVAGDALSLSAPGTKPVVRKASPLTVGSWQSGRLQYDDAPLDRIARDLGRNLGRPVRAAPGVERMHFTGTLVLKGSPEQVLARASPLLGVTFAADGEAWAMAPANGAHP